MSRPTPRGVGRMTLEPPLESGFAFPSVPTSGRHLLFSSQKYTRSRRPLPTELSDSADKPSAACCGFPHGFAGAIGPAKIFAGERGWNSLETARLRLWRICTPSNSRSHILLIQRLVTSLNFAYLHLPCEWEPPGLPFALVSSMNNSRAWALK